MALKLSVYGGGNIPAAEAAVPKIEFQLALAPNTTGPHGKKTKNDPDAIILKAVTPTGGAIKDGNLIKFKSDGTIYLYKTVNPGLGLPLDRMGRVTLGDE